MSTELSVIISRLLAQGYQIDSEAFAYLSGLSSAEAVESALRIAVESKSLREDRMIRREDVQVAPEGTEAPVGDREEEADIVVVSDPTGQIAPNEAADGFKRLFQDRYSRLLEVAKRRPDSKRIVPIDSISGTKEKSQKVAGLLAARNSSKRGGVELVLDDPSGSLKVYCGEDAAPSALAIPLDSLVVVDVSLGKGGQVYANELFSPDIPSRKPVVASHRAYAVLLSDLHIGSRMFLEEDFNRFLSWLNGELGDLDIVNRVRYVIIAGDVVDGIGVYPGQENQLAERNLRGQYLAAGRLLQRIPKRMKVLISPGNHDPVRQALPQPAVPPDVAAPLYGLENAVHLGGPAYVKLDGVNFLIYHGRSLDDVIATVPGLTYDRPVDAMQVLLKSRHLAPIYGKRTAISPEVRDMLVVDEVPDVFHAGHVHTIDVGNYRGTLMVNSGTFQSQTPFQANMGLDPVFSIVPILELSSLKVEKRSFTKQSFA